MADPQQMSSADAAWLHMDQPTNLMVITGALWFDERVDWSRARMREARREAADRPRTFMERDPEWPAGRLTTRGNGGAMD